MGNGKHLKLILDSGPHQIVYDAVAFRQGDRAPHLPEGALIDVVFTLEVNDFNGRRTLQWNVHDLATSAAGGTPAQ